MNDYYLLPCARKTILALSIVLCLAVTADAAVLEFGWGVKLGISRTPQESAQAHEYRMMKSDQAHNQRMARYSQPRVSYYRAPVRYGSGMLHDPMYGTTRYGYAGGTIYYQGRTTYAPPRVYYYQAPQSNLRYYR